MYSSQTKPVVTRIVNKFQVTVPPEIRDIFDLHEGDLFEWSFDEPAEAIRIVPKRAKILTPQTRATIADVRRMRAERNVRTEQPETPKLKR